MILKIKAIQKSMEQLNDWIADISEVYDFADENEAFITLRATLKALRDRISTEEAFHLASSLPAVVRGFYFEGWEPNKTSEALRSSQDFLHTVRKYLGGHEDIDLEMAVPEVMKVIFDKIDRDEAEHVMQNLPSEIQEIL